MPKDLLWKIYYADGQTRTNLSSEILPIGVVGIANTRRKGLGGWWLASKRDFYVLVEDREWWAVDYTGLMNYLQNNIGTAAVLFGAHVCNDTWEMFFNFLKTDPQLPKKTNRVIGEIGEDGTTVL